MHRRASRTLWPLGPQDPDVMPVFHGQTALHTKKGKKGKLFSQNRNTFRLESLIWVSDKAEIASQSI